MEDIFIYFFCTIFRVCVCVCVCVSVCVCVCVGCRCSSCTHCFFSIYNRVNVLFIFAREFNTETAAISNDLNLGGHMFTFQFLACHSPMNNSSADLVHSEHFDAMDDSCPFFNEDSTLEMCIKTAVYLLALLVSLLGNTLTLAFVYNTRGKASVARLFVSNMAVADLLITVFNMPAMIKEIISGTDIAFEGWAGDAVCKLLYFFQDVSIYNSILTLVAITVDQFLAITMPLRRRVSYNAGRRLTAVIWFSSALFATPLLYANQSQDIYGNGKFYECVEVWGSPFDQVDTSRNYTISLFIFLYAVPLVLMAVLYTCIINKIWKRKTPGNCSDVRRRAQERTKYKARRMFIAVVVLFALCWLPFHMNFFLLYFNSHYYQCGLPNYLWFIGMFLGHANSALNPCIYVICNESYRKGFRKVLRSACTNS